MNGTQGACEKREVEKKVAGILQMICNRFPLKDFKHGSDKIRFVFWKDKSIPPKFLRHHFVNY